MTTTNIIAIDSSSKPAIGAIESFTIEETKSLHNDGYAYTGVKLKITRMRFDSSKLNPTFRDSKFLVASQVYPFHIVVVENKVETIRATNVWLSGFANSYTIGEWIIAEGVEAECEFVTYPKTYESSTSE